MYTNGKSSKAKEWIQGLQLPKRQLPMDVVSAEEFQAREAELLAYEGELESLFKEMTPAEHAALRELREEIVRLPGGQKLHMILDAPAPALLVRSMPPQELLYNLKDIGLADCAEILTLAHKEQVTYMLDLDCWNKDHLDPEQITSWLQYLLSDDFEAAEQVLRAMDIEALVFYFQKLFVVHNTSEEEAPEDYDGERITTPFHYYTIDLHFDDADPMMPLARAALRLFEQYGYEFCHRLFESIRWSLPSELEEHSYQFHKGRMEDLGFVDYYEAISLYQPLPKTTEPFPASFKPEGMELPVLSSPQAFVGRLGAVMRLLEEEVLQRLRFELVFLHNKVIAAEQLEAGDPRVLERVMRFVQQMLELGLEAASGDESEKGAALLREHHLEWLFRVGFSEVLRLKKRAASLVREEGLTLFDRTKPFSLLPTHLQRFLSDLRLQNPRLFLGGIEPKATVSRSFRTLDEVRRANETLDYISFLSHLFFEQFGFSRGALVVVAEQLTAPQYKDDIRFSHLFLTAWAQLCLRGHFVLEPLKKTDLLPFLRHVFVEDAPTPRPLRDHVIQRLRDEFSQMPALSNDAERHIERFLQEMLDALCCDAASLPLDKEPDPRFFQLFLLS